MFKKILVPSDGSEFSQAAARRAVSFAKDTGAQLVAFNVKPEYPLSYYSATEINTVNLETPEQFDDEAEKHAQLILGQIDSLCRDAGLNCIKASTRSGTIYKAIIEAAREHGCDLIFMASHGRRGIGALLVGSETHKVITHSDIPVLVYR